MMEKMIALQQKRRSKKGGFTLVELIVVLVILAILAALLIPAIDKAKQKKIVAETRQCVMAAQTLYDEAYANVAANGTAATPADDKILQLAELTDKGALGTGDDHKVAFTKNKVSHLEYTRNGVTCVYNGSTYEVNPKSGK